MEAPLEDLLDCTTLFCEGSEKQISKNFFIKQFKSILVQLVDDQSFASRIKALSYSDAKNLAKSYNKSLDEFHVIYKDWMKIDRHKYYNFV